MRKNLTAADEPSELREAQALITLMARDVCKHAIDGRYVLLYDGDGEIDVGMDARAVAFQSGRIDFDFAPTCRRECWFDRAEWVPYCSDNGIALTVRRTDPANPVRNIRVVAPGFLASHELLPFHPWFVRHLTRYSTLRFMDWARTNDIPRSVVRSIAGVAAVRFNATKLRGPGGSGGSCVLLGDFFLFDGGDPVPIASAIDARTGRAMPEMVDGSEWTADCADGADGAGSIVFGLSAPTPIDAYAWRTSHTDRPERDPVRWVVEGLVDGTWQVLDRRTVTDQPVTPQRRRAALESMRAGSNLQFVGQTREISGDFPFQATASALEWADRVTPAHRSQAVGGVALEYQVLLANLVGADPWFCVHHLATDDYVRRMATLVRDTLRPDAKIFVEHSNEVWNAEFPQGEYARRVGMELGLHSAGGAANDCAHFGPEHVCAAIRYHARRSLEIFAIWIGIVQWKVLRCGAGGVPTSSGGRSVK